MGVLHKFLRRFQGESSGSRKGETDLDDDLRTLLGKMDRDTKRDLILQFGDKRQKSRILSPKQGQLSDFNTSRRASAPGAVNSPRKSSLLGVVKEENEVTY
ncbi:unnamed protein product [Choristocarpus tenellus]